MAMADQYYERVSSCQQVLVGTAKWRDNNYNKKIAIMAATKIVRVKLVNMTQLSEQLPVASKYFKHSQ